MIDSFSFGTMTIDGRSYTSDLMIFPDGSVRDSWWRTSGHVLAIGDISDLMDTTPNVLIAGTGVNGLMKPERGLSRYLAERGVEFMAGPNEKTVRWFNQKSPAGGVAACFHLSC